MADVVIVKGGAAAPSRVRRSNSSSYSRGFFGLNNEDLLKAGALVAGGLAIGYFGLQYIHRQGPSLDWSDLFTPPYSVSPPAKVPPTVVPAGQQVTPVITQSAYVEMAPEASQIEELDANMVISEAEDEAGAASVIVDEQEPEWAPESVSYAVKRYETVRDRTGELVGLTIA